MLTPCILYGSEIETDTDSPGDIVEPAFSQTIIEFNQKRDQLKINKYPKFCGRGACHSLHKFRITAKLNYKGTETNFFVCD